MKRIIIILLAVCNMNAATHIVTSNADDGEGSLRQIVADASSGDTIIFASDVNYITLTSGEIKINKQITIDGGSDISKKVTIVGNNNSMLFSISSYLFGTNNLIFTNGYGGAIYCPISVAMKFTATDCHFKQNSNGYGGAVYSHGGAGKFTAIRCSFYNNNGYDGGAVYNYCGTVIAINCNFYQNQAVKYGGGVNVSNGAKAYLYHCTFDSNYAEEGSGIGIGEYDNIYSYNCIYTGDTNQIKGTISGDGKNLIEKINCTREKVFGNNEYENGYIKPLEFAKSAERLTAIDIEVPNGMSADSIISLLKKDLIGKDRPDTGFVTYGAVEFDGIGIKSNGSFDVLVLPNPTENDFNIIFENTETQKISIELLDLEGKKSLDIFDGVA